MAAKKQAAKKTAAKKLVRPPAPAAQAPAAAPAPAAPAPLQARAPAPAAPAAPAPDPRKLSSIGLELALATGLTMLDNENQNQFAIRLAEAVSVIPDEKFNALTQPARTWFDAAVIKSSANEAIDLPGEPGAPDSAGAPAPGATPAAPAAPKAPAQPRTDGVAHKVRSSVVNNPAIDFASAAAAAGVEAKVGGHAFNIFNEAKAVMKLVLAKTAPAA